jgi:hypothetical protein
MTMIIAATIIQNRLKMICASEVGGDVWWRFRYMFCIECGEKLDDGVKFCSMCGAKQTVRTMEAQIVPTATGEKEPPAEFQREKKPALVCSNRADFEVALNDTNDGIIIIKYKGSETEVIIPSEFEGFPVVAIASAAFGRTGSLSSSFLPSLAKLLSTIQETTEISRLTKIKLPDSLTQIGRYAFAHCTSLTQMEFPNLLTQIGRYAFAYCTSLTQIELPSSLTQIDGTAFYACSGLNLKSRAALRKLGHGNTFEEVNLPSK